MISIVYGKKGSGKTKKMIEQANAAALSSDGNVYFLNVDNSYMYELKYQVRFINTSEYKIEGAYLLLGFINGLAASNFDLKHIYIDGFLKHMDRPITELSDLFSKLDAFANEHNTEIVLSVSGEKEDLPGFMQKYIA